MKELVFASNNPYKVQEIRSILSEKFKLKSLKDIGCHEDIPETGFTLKANAALKSHFVAKNYQMDCFADDTGLEVKVLGGRPGVYSARYAGKNATYAENVVKLLKEMKGKHDRTARFRTVISLIYEGSEYFFEGVIEGKIIEETRGNEGFGYDPVFIPDGYDETFAEMDPELKNRISHRAKATQKLVRFLLSDVS